MATKKTPSTAAPAITSDILQQLVVRLAALEAKQTTDDDSVPIAIIDPDMLPENQAPETHNELIEVEALCLLSYDGHSNTPGIDDWYAPSDFDVEAHLAKNEIDGPLVDGDGEPILITGNRFEVTRIVAEAMAKAKMVRII